MSGCSEPGAGIPLRTRRLPSTVGTRSRRCPSGLTRRRGSRLRWALAWLLATTFPAPVAAQLISPGKLSEAHQDLEGMGNCTQCHRLRARGVDPERCLDCHEALARKIRAGTGYHGSVPREDCGECHKEHLGKSFQVAHFVADDFVHDSTGFELRGRHGEAECRSCHQPGYVVDADVREFKAKAGALDRTYLGLPTDCGSCHGVDDPHGEQFEGEDCGSCHDEWRWEEASGFDHSRATFLLEGAHREVACNLCHKAERREGREPTVRYRPVDAATCGSCHEDPHRGRMRGSCDGCHRVEGWRQLRSTRVEDSFDHGATSFALEGAHAEAACRACHVPNPGIQGVRLRFPRGELGNRTYPRPLHGECASCHADPHSGSVEGRGCDACHGLGGWTPASFDLSRHDAESEFSLTGAHRVTPCVDCHTPEVEEPGGVTFRVDGFEDCASCHADDDPHEGDFGDTACRICHETSSFLMERFDHERAELGDLVDDCTTCHGKTQPHGDQFPGGQCGSCHTTDTFEIPDFDHSQARFQLDGAHEDLDCGECHRREPNPDSPGGFLVRYRPLEFNCSDCHGGGV